MSNALFSKLITSSVIVKGKSTPEDWKRPSENQREAQKHFPILVETSRLNLWNPGDSIPQQGLRFLIGAATYSLIEMYLLDALNVYLERERAIVIDVIDLSTCISLAAVDKYIPNATPKASPILGVWSDGQVVRVLDGGKANKYIRDYFKLDSILESLMERESEISDEIERLRRENRTGFVRR